MFCVSYCYREKKNEEQGESESYVDLESANRGQEIIKKHSSFKLTQQKANTLWANIRQFASSHPDDIYTPQPSSLSLNTNRNRLNIFIHSGFTAVKYPLITSIIWLYWHCDQGLKKCEHNTQIEYFTAIQFAIGTAVFLYNFICSLVRLDKEAKSIKLTMQVSESSHALTLSLLEGADTHARQHIKKFSQLVLDLANNHPNKHRAHEPFTATLGRASHTKSASTWYTSWILQQLYVH